MSFCPFFSFISCYGLIYKTQSTQALSIKLFAPSGKYLILSHDFRLWTATHFFFFALHLSFFCFVWRSTIIIIVVIIIIITIPFSIVLFYFFNFQIKRWSNTSFSLSVFLAKKEWEWSYFRLSHFKRNVFITRNENTQSVQIDNFVVDQEPIDFPL